MQTKVKSPLKCQVIGMIMNKMEYIFRNKMYFSVCVLKVIYDLSFLVLLTVLEIFNISGLINQT